MIKNYFKTVGVISVGIFFLMGDVPCNDCPPSSYYSGYLIDSPLVGVDYYCNSNEKNRSETSSFGWFYCDDENTTSILFKLGKLEIGEIKDLEKRVDIYPQDILGISKEDFTDERLILLTRFLQSLDDDGNISRNIKITQEVKDSFPISQFSDMSIDDVETALKKINKPFVTEVDAIKHLKDSMNRDRNITKDL